MGLIIATQGQSSHMTVCGRKRAVIPFVGANYETNLTQQMGIGLFFPQERDGMFWGLDTPHLLIRAWHSMKLLEQLSYIEYGTLYACWGAASPQINNSNRHQLIELTEQFADSAKFEQLRTSILTSVPSMTEIESMISMFKEYNVSIDSFDLAIEVEAGRITASPAIRSLLREAEERCQPCLKTEGRPSDNQLH